MTRRKTQNKEKTTKEKKEREIPSTIHKRRKEKKHCEKNRKKS